MIKSLKLFSIIFLLVISGCSSPQRQADTAESGCISGDCANGRGVYIWPDGNKYDGEWLYKKFHGDGTFYYNDGRKYTGQWSNGNREGKGTLWLNNGDVYYGSFANNEFNGKGKYTYADGTIEEGEFCDSLFVDRVILPSLTDRDKKQAGKVIEIHRSTGEIVITGEKLNKDDKLFIEIDEVISCLQVISAGFPDSRCRMIGETRRLLKNATRGQPVFRYISGIKRGASTWLFPNGSVYNGESKGKLMHGKGEFSRADGTVYTGYFSYGLRNGKGTVRIPSRGRYEGEWRSGRYYKGKFTWSDGSAYEGEFSRGVMHGNGRYTWPDGAYYTGSWYRNRMHGYGAEYDSSRKLIRKGRWENDIYTGTR